MRRKILIIEDEEYIADIYRLKFTGSGYEVAIAGDGESGYAKAVEYQPDLILLDLVLPKLDGYNVLGKIKKNKKINKIPVIITSNLGQKEEMERGIKLGAADYLIKSNITPADLLKKAKKYL